jgi:hypothetical protein
LRLIMSSRPRQSSMTAHSRLVRRIASCRLSRLVRWYSMGAHCSGRRRWGAGKDGAVGREHPRGGWGQRSTTLA